MYAMSLSFSNCLLFSANRTVSVYRSFMTEVPLIFISASIPSLASLILLSPYMVKSGGGVRAALSHTFADVEAFSDPHRCANLCGLPNVEALKTPD